MAKGRQEQSQAAVQLNHDPAPTHMRFGNYALLQLPAITLVRFGTLGHGHLPHPISPSRRPCLGSRISLTLLFLLVSNSIVLIE